MAEAAKIKSNESEPTIDFMAFEEVAPKELTGQRLCVDSVFVAAAQARAIPV